MITQDVKTGINIAYQGTGAYLSAIGMAQQYAFEQALAQAVEMGLAGTAATQYANQAAANVATSKIAATVSSYLPFIGVGLAAYNAITGKIHGGDQALLTAMLAMGTVNPMFYAAAAFFAIPMMLTRPDVDNHVYVHNPELEVVHVDEEGNYYLYDTSIQEEKGKVFTETMNFADDRKNYGRGSLIRFNPETNEITRGHIGVKYNKRSYLGSSDICTHQLTLEQTRELFANGVVSVTNKEWDKKTKEYVQTTKTVYLNPETDEEWANNQATYEPQRGFSEPVRRKKGFIRWYDGNKFNPEIKAMGGRGAAGMYNVRALQAELYNKVLLPNNLIPPVQWEPITVGGVDYLIDPSGAVANTEGMIVGGMDLETGQISSLQSQGRLKYNSHGRICGGQENPVIGTIDQMPSADFFTPPTVNDSGGLIPDQPRVDEPGDTEPWPEDPTLWEEEPVVDNRIRVGPGAGRPVSPEMRNRIILGQGPGRQITPYQSLKQTIKPEQTQETNMALPPFLQRSLPKTGRRPVPGHGKLGRLDQQYHVPGGPGGGPPVAPAPGDQLSSGGPGGGPVLAPAPGDTPQSGLGGILSGKLGDILSGKLGGSPKNKSSLEAVLSILRQLVNSGQLR